MTEHEARQMLKQIIDRELASFALVHVRETVGVPAVAAIALHAIGYSPRHIAEILDVSPDEVLGLLRRARDAVRELDAAGE